jgi:hypothetical protein
MKAIRPIPDPFFMVSLPDETVAKVHHFVNEGLPPRHHPDSCWLFFADLPSLLARWR